MWSLCKYRKLNPILLWCCMLSKVPSSWAVNFFVLYILLLLNQFFQSCWTVTCCLHSEVSCLPWMVIPLLHFSHSISNSGVHFSLWYFYLLLEIHLKSLDEHFPAFCQVPSPDLLYYSQMKRTILEKAYKIE